MLKALHIRNYILIDSLDISFPEGLVIISGQTGAGKSILLGALSLLLGGRSESSVISEGADNCVVEAEFDSDDNAVRAMLEENDAEWDGGHITVRRVVHSSGRTRSFVNDCPVQLSVLSSISSRLVDIHSQHQSLMLSDKPFQLSVLDHFAGNCSLLQEFRKVWRSVQSLKSELSSVEDRLFRMSSEREYNEAQFARLDAARLRDGELEELEAEQRQLANAEDIKSALGSVEEMFNPSDGEGVSVILKEAQKALLRASRFLPDAESLSERIESSRLELDDVLSEISKANSAVEISPERLQVVEDRMSMLYDLLRLHSCSCISELIAVRDSLSALLFDSTSLEDHKKELIDRISAESKELESLSDKLHSRRLEAAPELSSRIQESLRFLELDRAVFRVEVNDREICDTGSDVVSFLFSSNGKPAVDVSRCASGGEISRIMLCLKSIMAEHTQMPTMIFDEIDTGVSGSVADKMGSMICSMGNNMQVFAITHLPQVAAKGNAHFLVSKDDSARVTSSIKKLSPEERVLEIARMLSGSEITEEAVANARRLLS